MNQRLIEKAQIAMGTLLGLPTSVSVTEPEIDRLIKSYLTAKRVSAKQVSAKGTIGDRPPSAQTDLHAMVINWLADHPLPPTMERVEVEGRETKRVRIDTS